MLRLGQRREIKAIISRLHSKVSRKTVHLPDALKPQAARETLEVVVKEER